jgi:hypothetical protein
MYGRKHLLDFNENPVFGFTVFGAMFTYAKVNCINFKAVQFTDFLHIQMTHHSYS